MLKKFLKLLFLLILSLSIFGCITNEVIYDSAATMLPQTERLMKTPGFWISKLNEPDKILLNQDEIIELNASIEDKIESVKDITKFEKVYQGEKLRKQLDDMFKYIKGSKLYFADGKLVTDSFYNDVKKNMDVDKVPDEIDIKYGFITKFSDQRVFPSDKLLNDIPKELFFDSLQMSALDIATPIIILHESLDKEWLFVQGTISDGWIKKENVVLCTEKQFYAYLNNESFVIIKSAKSDIYLDKNLNVYYDYARMGVMLPLFEKTTSDVITIIIPFKNAGGSYQEKKAYVNIEEINIGYLPFTLRNIINQSFKLLNTPYGWGGMFGEQDCSKLLCEIYSTFGIIFPRNSSQQVNTCKLIKEFDKYATDNEKLDEIRNKAIPGITLLGIPGHIMLYLGWYDNKPYVIHSIWAYKEKISGKERVRLINKTTVSDLSIGVGSKKGSLLNRLNKINVIQKAEE